MASMKLEQSSMREETPGTFPARVPVTARAQLSALQAGTDATTAGTSTSETRNAFMFFTLSPLLKAWSTEFKGQ